MKRYILLIAILISTIPQLIAQSNNCTQTDACFQYKLLGATRFDEQRVKLMFTMKTMCNNNLDYVAFELPEGSNAAGPADIQQRNNNYIVRNGKTSSNGKNQIDTKFNAIQYNAKNTATINSGKEDLFEFYVTNEDYNKLAATGMRVEAKTINGTKGQVTFNLKTCAAVPAPGQDPKTTCSLELDGASIGFIDAMDFPDGNTVVRFLLKNKTANDINQVIVKTPSSPQPIAVASENNGSAYKAKYHYKTTVDQDTDLITFSAQNTKGYSNGSADVFAVVLPTALFNTDPNFEFTINTGSTTITTGFNAQTCEDAAISPLPVELISFEGIATKSGIELNWSTASETDNIGFEVERSQNGNTFTQIGKVAGAGNSSIKQTYTYTDATANQGTHYYRLKQLDSNGSFAYSKLIAVTLHKSITSDNLSIYPNPVVGNMLTVALKNNVAHNGHTALQIMNTNGDVVHNQKITAGTNQMDIFMPDLKLPGGIYLVKLHYDNHTETRKLIIP
jgi:hypothetical protein